MRAHSVTFLCSPAMARDGEIIQRQHFCHYGDTICHPRPGCVTTKLHGTSTADATMMRYFQQNVIDFPLSEEELTLPVAE